MEGHVGEYHSQETAVISTQKDSPELPQFKVVSVCYQEHESEHL